MSANHQLPPPPIFGVIGDNKVDRPGIISLVDIFDEFLFSNDRVGGINIQGTGFIDKTSYKNGPAVKDFLGDDYDSYDDEEDDDDDDNEDGRKRKRGRGLQRNMTEEQKVERR